MKNSVNLFNSNLAEIKITYRNKQKFSEMRKVNSSIDAVDVLRSIWSDQIEYREEFAIICLNRANKVLGYSFISSGGLAGTVVDAKVVFQIALKSNASSIILAHNHPSGNKQPSNPDINLTKKLKQAGALLDLPVLDHLILTSETYYSLADEGDI
jgi:DNA repair protein RadC